MKYRSSVMLVSIALLALTACGGQSSGNGDDASAANSASSADTTETVAKVNNQNITKAALDAQLQAMSRRGQQANPKQALNNLIQLELMKQEAESEGIAKQPEIQAQIQRQRSSLLAQHLIRAKMSQFKAGDDELRQAYKDKVASMADTEYKARHILLKTKAQAQKMIDQLDKGADFKKLAKENSTGPTKSKGGQLGWFSADQMVQPFVDAVKKMKPGDYSEKPVQTQYGWHVIELEDTREAKKPSFKQLKPNLRNQIIGEKIQTYISKLRNKADVEIVDKDLGDKADSDGSKDDNADQDSNNAGSDGS